MFSKPKRYVAFILLFLITTLSQLGHAQAQGPVVLTDEQDEYPLGLYLEILEDPSRQLTIEKVASPEFDRLFVRNQIPELNLGLADTAYWVRFHVNNQARQTGEWWLEIASFEVNNVSVYYPHPDGRSGFAQQQGGNAFPGSGRETNHYYPAFKIPIPPQSEQTIYLRVEGQRINLPLTLWSGAGYIRESQKDFIALGLYWGILFIMAGYNFFLFLALREKSYLYYVLFMANLLIIDFLRRYLTNLWPSLDGTIFLLPIATLLFIFLIQFTATFLMTKLYAPRLHRFFRGLQIGLATTAPLYLLWTELNVFIFVWLISILLSVVAIFTSGLVVWRQGYRPARYFVLGLAMILGSVFLSILAVLGLLPTSYTEHTGNIGFALMALLMSLALADRINLIKQEQEQAEAETHQRNRELTLLNRVIASTTAVVEPKTVLDVACRELVQAFKLTHAVAVLADENNTEVKVVADYHPEGNPSILGQSFPIEGNPLLEHVAAYREPLTMEDAQSDPRTTSVQQLLHLRNTVSLLLFPIIVEREIVGGLSLGSNKPRHFSAAELDLVQSVAEQVSGVLVRIRLIEERQRLQAQYHQAQKMDALGRMAGGIAHDFNNLLVPIIGYVELAMVTLTSKHKLYPNLERVHKAADRAATLTRQILAFSRKQVLDIKSVNLNDVVSDFNKMLVRLIGEHIDVQLLLEPSLHPVKVDRSQIEQILMNLAVNARDAMPEGGKLIIETDNVILDENYPETFAEVIPGPYAMIAVSDSGCGMDEEIRRRIFEPFFTTKDQGKGTGLGLATVHGIVKQHGGHILVYSEPNVGTTFKIFLPMAKEETTETEGPMPEPTAHGGTETVLVVEDEEGVRKLVGETLESYGYHVLEAKNPEEGLRIATDYPATIDLLLTDVIMPGMNGQEFYQKVNKIRPDIQVLYMSGYTDSMIVRDGILEKGTNYLQKPFNIQGLTQKVRKVLNAKSN